ncbi:hypothetical protein [Pedobacter alpinus]|uniref:Uncharacterized protein n=1 Tax=Pedobacter alpinus TaxID=1590643 RepID=A0ABW5TVN4_9SPHI
MSSGKCIYAYGVSALYHPKPDVFLQRLSLALGCNLNAFFYDIALITTADKELNINNGFKNELTIIVAVDRDFEENYFISIPINHEEEVFDVEFYPTGIISMMHIPFTQGWRFFIEDILDENSAYYGGWKAYREKMEAIRALYIPIFKKLQCEQVFLSTNAHHNWFYEIEKDFINQQISFNTILEYAKTIDQIAIFKLKEVFERSYHQEIKKLYDTNEYFKIAFLDEF